MSAIFKGIIPEAISPLMRDNFSTSTWLLFGACLQSALVLSLPRFIALMPAFLCLIWRVLESTLMAYGITHNLYMDGVKEGKWTAQIPNDDGGFPEKAANKDMVVLLLGTRSNQ